MFSCDLKELAMKLNLEYEVKKCFEGSFHEYMDEFPEEINDVIDEYSAEKLETWIHSISIKCNNWPELDYCNIVTELKIIYDDEEIGVFYYYCNLQGELTDVILRIH